MIKGSVFGDHKDINTLTKSSYSMKPVDAFQFGVVFSLSETILMRGMRFLALCTALFASSVLLLFVINRETENEALKIPERASLNGK